MMETVRRTIQLAHVMHAWRASSAGAGHLGLPIDPDDPFDSTDRVLRYLAKVTVEPAIAHSTGATGSADARGRARYQMSPTVKPSGNGSVGSTT